MLKFVVYFILFLIFVPIIYLIIVTLYFKKRENFQYVLEKHSRQNSPPLNITPLDRRLIDIDYIKPCFNNKLFRIRVSNEKECDRICRQIEGCQGYNHALNMCTLYKNLQSVEPPRKPFIVNI